MIVLLLFALIVRSDSYFFFLRWAVFIIGSFFYIYATRNPQMTSSGWGILYIAFLFFYNPFYVQPFGVVIWKIVDILSILMIFKSIDMLDI